jgi:hypothetical protein
MVNTNRLYSLRRADRIIALDRFMKECIQAKGIRGEKVLVLSPWAHDDGVRFDPAGREEFRHLLRCTYGDAKRKNLSE